METQNTMGDVNVVRLERDGEFVRFEIARGTDSATMHNSRGEKFPMNLGDVRERVARLTSAAGGWRVVS